MNRTKRFMAFALTILILLPMIAFAEGGRLHDGAGLLDEAQAKALAEKLDSTSESTGIYVGVVTTQSIGDATIEDFADEYYHANSMGAGEDKDGVVAFVAMESRDIYIYTYGDRAKALFDDARIDEILDAIAPNLTSESYLLAFSLFAINVNDISKAGIKDDQYIYDTDTGAVSDGYRDPEPLIDPMWVLASFGISLGVAALACAGVVGKYKLFFVPDSYPFREKGRLELTRKEDTFLHKHLTSRVIQDNNYNSGGGTHGGGGSRSSVSRSVGGGTHGGGGRKF